MKNYQIGILDGETKLGRYMTFSIHSITNIAATLISLKENIDSQFTVVGFGESLITALGKEIPGLRTMPAQSVGGIEIPSTPQSLWIWLRGTDRGEILHRSRKIEAILADAFSITSVIDSFQFDKNRDLSGYEDGTENPEGDDALVAAIFSSEITEINGGSFVAVQQWLHDLDIFEQMDKERQDNTFGRHAQSNDEFDAPSSAHVKRAAQEDFEPEAFMVRRSMPWADGMDSGLVFVSFANNLDKFEAVMNRMIGKDDGIIDALFDFTRPINGAYYWCPPTRNGKLNLSSLGL
ncbi:MAG: Dyp-type peroxidase [Kordiimonadaceae bacterium]|nr:Dyp-type peroxidase [Kordiimonadaceae bacterium]